MSYLMGKIEGTVQGNVWKGKWSEAPSYSEPRDKGDVELELSKRWYLLEWEMEVRIFW